MIIQPITGSTTTSQPKRTGGGVIAPIADTNLPVLQRKTTTQTVSQPQVQTSKIGKVATETGKFLARTGVEAVNVATALFDFTADFLASTIEKGIRGKPTAVTPIGSNLIATEKQKEAKNKIADKWIKFYEEKGGQPTEKLKSFTEKLRQIEYIQPSEDWQKASTKEKLTKRLPETILNIGPGVVASLGSYALNPVYGFLSSAGSTADEIKTIAVENGVPKEKAEMLGLATGLLIGWIDKRVPDEIFSPAQKKQFVGGLVKRVVKTGLKEAGTEIVQENVQLLVESTLRDDLGMDEVVLRNVMAGLGGLLGGVGAQSTVSFINGIRSGDIADIGSERVLVDGKLPAGEYTLQEAVAKVADSPIENTPEGKAIVKAAIEAEKRGTKLILPPQRAGLLEAPKPSGMGENFTMTEKADQRKIEIGKKLNDYRYAMERFNANPTPTTRVRFEKARAIVNKLNKEGYISPQKVVSAATPPPKAGAEIAEKTEIKPKEVSVPREQLPVGQGEEKLSRLEARVAKVLDKAPQEVKKQLGLTTYNQMNKKENISKAVKYISENQDEALAVLRGEKEAPSGILRNSIYVAMQNQAEGDVNLARKLASLQSTRLGQEISILTEIDPDSPVKLLGDIVKVKEEAFKKRYKDKSAKEVKDKVAKDIKKTVKAPDKYDWDNFINSIICK